MEELLHHLTFNFSGAGVRKETLDGREYLVAPGTLMTPGVRKGTDGPVFYSKDFLSKDVLPWGKIPIVYTHPVKDGQFISANTEGVLDTSGMGHLDSPTNKDGVWRADHYFDVEKTKKIDQRVILALNTGTPFNTSTGMFLKRKQKSGTEGGKAYTSVAEEYKPDHLAVLMDRKGACSVEDGCGVLTANEASFNRIIRRLEEACYAKMGYRVYVRDVYTDFFVYSDGNHDLFKQSYSVDADGIVTMGTDAAVKVKWVTEYRTDGGDFVGNCSCASLDKEMNVNKAASINSLIANGAWAETDRVFLDTLPEDKLANMAKQASPKPPAILTPPPAVPPTNNQGTITLESLIANADPETQAAFNDMKAAGTQMKQSLIANIQVNPRNRFAPEFLATLPVDQLRGMSELAQVFPTNNYAPMGGGIPILNNNAGKGGPALTPLVPPDVILTK